MAKIFSNHARCSGQCDMIIRQIFCYIILMEDTGFKDKFGKPISIGDEVQYKLDGKGRGPIAMTVVKRGKKIVAVQKTDYGDGTFIALNSGSLKFISILKKVIE